MTENASLSCQVGQKGVGSWSVKSRFRDNTKGPNKELIIVMIKGLVLFQDYSVAGVIKGNKGSKVKSDPTHYQGYTVQCYFAPVEA